MILSLLLGAAAMAAGAGDAGMGIDGGRPAGGDGQVPRLQPRPGEQRRPGRRHLPQPRRDQRPRLARFFQQAAEPRIPATRIPQDDAYAHTHPLTGERIAGAREAATRPIPAWNPPTDPALEARFQRVRAKLSGYVDDPRAGPDPLSGEQPQRSRPIMPGLMPGTGPAIPTRPMPRRTPCSRPRRTIPISSSSRARSCSKRGHPAEALAVAARGGRSARPTSR